MKSKNIVIGYISPNSPDDRKASSGTLYTIINALNSIDGVEILWIPISYNNIWKKLTRYKKAFERITHVSIPFSFAKLHATAVKNTISEELIDQCDILFCAFQAPALYGLKTKKPIVYLSDATYASMINYYYHNESFFEQRSRNQIEQNALNLASAVVLSSNWAANSAIHDYGQQENKIHVVEFGANIDEKDIIKHDFKYDNHLNILFLGVDWKRKGGQIAVDTCQWLNENGIPATLNIVGIKDVDESIKKLPYVNFIGFLNKNDSVQYKKLVEIIQQCHCLLLPTLAECSAIAFCEASANGLPVFSHITGGVPNYIIDGKNGHLLPIGSSGNDFGRIIRDALENGELEKMSLTAVEVYKEKLNWDVWTKKVKKIIFDLI